MPNLRALKGTGTGTEDIKLPSHSHLLQMTLLWGTSDPREDAGEYLPRRIKV